MATQVEVGSALASLASLREPANDAELPCVLVSPLSAAGGQPGELPSPLSPLRWEDRGPFGNLSFKPATMTPATSRPRLTPKPFCRERSAETFAIVRPPVPALKPSNVAPKPSVFAPTSEDVSVARGLTGNVPPLVDQKLVESKASGDLVATMPFYSSPQANTVILFETGSTDRVRMTWTPGKDVVVGVPRALSSTFPAQEGQRPPSESEASSRGIHRQLPLSSQSRPGSWNPGRPLERTDAPEKEKVQEGEQQPSSRSGPASEMPPRLKQRPVSAIFLESLKDQKCCAPDVPEEKGLPEKPWVRKPRPLSVDLTAKFESRDLSVPRKPCPLEAKEQSRADGGHGRLSEAAGAPKSVAAAGLGRADCIADSSPGAKSVLHPPPAQPPSSCHSTPKESSPSSAKDREDLWGRRRRSREEQPEREAALGAAASGRNQEPPRSKGRSAQERTVLNPKESRLGAGDSSAHAADAERRSARGGEVQKLLSLPETSANGAALANPASLPESPEKEGRILNIQQRIKELTADNAGAKPGNLRRSFRSRPLSADLTKRFSSPATGSEGRLERQADPNRNPLGETREVPEKEASLPCGADCREARVLGPPWNPQQPPTDGHLERQNVALQGEGPPPVAAPESTALKTVRATLFEHSVQRHNVALDSLASEPASQLAPGQGGGRLGGGRELWPEESQPMARNGPSKQAAKPAGPAKSFHADPALAAATWEKYVTQEKLEQAATQKHMEDSLKHQRIEPRYEILQTVGERVQSEAVAAVSEDKAVTLRSRRSLKERRKTQEGLVALPWPGNLGPKGQGWKEDGPGEAAAAAVKTTSGKEGRISHSQITELSNSPTRPQQPVPAKASYFPSRKQDVGTTDDTVSSLSSEIEKEKPGVSFADHVEGYKIAKRFPESFGAGPGRAEYGYDTSANVGENNMAPGKAGQRESPSSALGGGSQWPKYRSQASPPSVDTKRPSGQEGSQAVAFRTAGVAYCAKEEGGVSSCLAEGERFGPLEGGERIRRSGLGSAERWRRKTLPHGAARFEDAGALAQEGMRAFSRRDSLQLQNRSAAKRTREPRCGAELSQEGSRPAASPQQQQQQLSPSEPKAASGAVPAQGPAGHEPALDPLQSQPVSPVVENTWSSSASRRSHRHLHKRLADAPGSLDRHLSKSWAERGTSGGSKSEPSDARGETWRTLERRLDGAPERSAAVDPPFQAAPTSPSYSRPFPQGRERFGPPRGSSQDLAKRMGADGYRSRVLDIDALMAEYREDPRREGGLSEESSWFPWERLGCRRNSADKTSGSSNASSPRGLDSSPRSTRPGIPGAEFRWPETGRPSEPGKAESCGQDRAVTFSPPLTAEKPTKYLPADPSSSRKKTFILDEEPGESLLRRHPSAKHASCARVDAEPGASGAPPPSQLLPGGVSRRGTSPKQQASAPSEEDCRQAAHVSGLSKGSGSAGVGVEARAKGKSSAPGLANAPLDLRRSSSEKVRQARGRSSLPLGPEVREGLHPSPFPGRAEGWPGQRSASQQDSSFREEEEEKRQGPGSPAGGRSPPYLPVQRRSRSFYRERRTDRWAAETPWICESQPAAAELLHSDTTVLVHTGEQRAVCAPPSWDPPKQPPSKPEPASIEDQLKECFGRPAAEAKDTDTLVPEADSQYGTWSGQRHRGDSFAPESPSSESHVASARKQPPGSRLSSFSSQTDQQDSARDQRSTSLDRSSTDVESADGMEGPVPAGACPDFSFLEHTPVLDSSALKTRVQLSKRRRQHRAPISHSLRRSPAGDVDHRLSAPQEVDSAWMFQDCTEAKSAKRGEEEEEEETMRPVERSPSSQPQRLPVFPGMDHSVLKAQLRKRQDLEEPVDGRPAQLSKSPKSPFQARAVGGRVLPTGVEKEERSEESSPQWLRELKSKKRQSQYENQV